jgi:hypothetical protein
MSRVRVRGRSMHLLVRSSFLTVFILSVATSAATADPSATSASGHLDERYEGMLEGVTSNARAIRVPCQIVAPVDPGEGSDCSW